MRSSILAAAPFVAAAYATTTSYGTTLVPELNSNGQTVTSTYVYSNPATNYLTQTNSDGVVTGLPNNGQPAAVTTQPTVVTSQPAVATIPAGLPVGDHTLTLNVSSTASPFTVSVGKSTTQVIGGTASVTTSSNANASNAAGSGNGGSGGSGNGGSGNGGSGGSASSSSSSSSSSSGAAPGNVKVASAGVLGLGALFAALL